MWVTTSIVKCDSSPSCDIQEICDKMEMEGGMSGVSSTGYSKTSQVELSDSQSVTEKKKKTIKPKGMNMCNELCLSLVSISFVLFSVNI